MKKICINTITLGSNFGNRLQNYALQSVLENNGYSANTVKNLTGESAVFNKFPILYSISSKIISLKITSFVISKFFKNAKLLKKSKFMHFNEEYINWADTLINKEVIPARLITKYDGFICGSDQIWNPQMKFNSDVEFLTYVKEKPKISYAASFGISDLDNEYLKRIKAYLSDFNAISVREERGKELLKDIGINNVEVVLDPTLLIESTLWKSLEKKPSFEIEDSKYILYYNLKCNSEENLRFVKDISKKYNYKIIDVLDKSNYKYYGIDPFEFIYLIDHAAYVCTDSFHATVFSLLFHKQFISFDRAGMNSRLHTLLDIGSLNDRIFYNEIELFIEERRFDVFDNEVDGMRRSSLDFLLKSLGESVGV